MSKQQMSASKKNYLGLGIMAVLSAVVIAVSGPLYQSMVKHPDTPLADGTYTYEAEQPDDNGFRDLVTMTVTDGRITACSWDSLNADNVGKRQLSMEGQYIMTESGPTWKAQADALASYVLHHQTIRDMANAEGYTTDTISSVSINVYPFINGLNACMEQSAVKAAADTP